MADIQFDEPSYAPTHVVAVRYSWLTNLVIRTGLASDEAGAQKMLLVVLIVAVIATIGVLWFGGGASTKQSNTIPANAVPPEGPVTHRP